MRLPVITVFILLPALLWRLFTEDPIVVLAAAATAGVVSSIPVVIAVFTLPSARHISGVQGAVGFGALLVAALGPFGDQTWHFPAVLAASSIVGASWAGMPAHVRDWKTYWLKRIPDELLEPCMVEEHEGDEQVTQSNRPSP